MARVVPSLIVEAIRRQFDWAFKEERSQPIIIGQDRAPQVGMVLELLEALPPELHPVRSEDLAHLVIARGAMRAALLI